MNDRYGLFQFDSIGVKGRITKVIQFIPMDLEDFFNLGFGDLNPATGEIDDLAVSNNGDSEKVLATVANALYLFTEEYPEAMVTIIGNSKARSRLYRMGISKYFDEVSQTFDIYGDVEGVYWEKLQPNKNYARFLVTRK